MSDVGDGDRIPTTEGTPLVVRDHEYIRGEVNSPVHQGEMQDLPPSSSIPAPTDVMANLVPKLGN